jgi:hypothetical protein
MCLHLLLLLVLLLGLLHSRCTVCGRLWLLLLLHLFVAAFGHSLQLLLLLVCIRQAPSRCLLLDSRTATTCFAHHLPHEEWQPHTCCRCSGAAGGSKDSVGSTA